MNFSLTEEHKMMKDSVIEFVDREIVPKRQRFEKKDYKLTEEIMSKIGELGFLGVSVPEQYGGLGMGLNISMLICGEISSYSGSIATAYGAHTGIGTLPILFYGNEEVKNTFKDKLTEEVTMDVTQTYSANLTTTITALGSIKASGAMTVGGSSISFN